MSGKRRWVDVVVVGAGQAGLATSYGLTQAGIDHVVLEAGTVGESWRSRRWSSFRLVSPNRLNRLPGAVYDGDEPDNFLTRDQMVGYLEGYARAFRAPVERDALVHAVRAREADAFEVDLEGGTVGARSVVIATGAFGDPRVPPMGAGLSARVLALHTDDYRNPESLPPGGVLVVGAGQSGLQIAEELALAGREAWVSVGRFGWVPRRPFGKDQMVWRDEMGDFAKVVAAPDAPDLAYPFTPLSRWGFEDFNTRTVARCGVRLAGHIRHIDGERVSFSEDLHETLAEGDAYAVAFVRRVAEFARARGQEVVVEEPPPNAWTDVPLPAQPNGLNLALAGISTVIWATGFRHDFRWVRADAFAPNGSPYQIQGVSRVPGLYFVGMHRMYAGGSGTILGVGPDALHVAGHIAQRERAATL